MCPETEKRHVPFCRVSWQDPASRRCTVSPRRFKQLKEDKIMDGLPGGKIESFMNHFGEGRFTTKMEPC